MKKRLLTSDEEPTRDNTKVKIIPESNLVNRSLYDVLYESMGEELREQK